MRARCQSLPTAHLQPLWLPCVCLLGLPVLGHFAPRWLFYVRALKYCHSEKMLVFWGCHSRAPQTRHLQTGSLLLFSCPDAWNQGVGLGNSSEMPRGGWAPGSTLGKGKLLRCSSGGGAHPLPLLAELAALVLLGLQAHPLTPVSPAFSFCPFSPLWTLVAGCRALFL